MMDKALLSKIKKQVWVQRYPRVAPAVLFVIGLAATLFGVYGVERAESFRHQMELQSHAAAIAAGIERRATAHITVLHAAAAVFSGRDGVSEEEFASFSAGLRKSDAYEGSLGLGWAEVVVASRRDQFEAERRRLGRSGFTITPPVSGGRGVVVPIVYLDPADTDNRRAIGFDMYSEPVRRKAMDGALRLGQPMATGKVRLMQDSNRPDSAGFLIYMPVFQGRPGQSSIKGFVYIPFRAQEFLVSAIDLSESMPVSVSLYSDSMDQPNLMARHSKHITGSFIEQELNIANHKWWIGVTMHQTPGLTSLSRAILAFGLILSLLVLVISRLITRRAVEDRMVLEWMTEQSAIRNALTRELNHRVKNTLANVLSIVALTRRRTKDLDEFSSQLTARLQALSATHDLLSHTDWRHASIDSLMRAELAPYMHEKDSRLQIEGPDVNLAPNEALSLGLVIHELATNAAKYGALSADDGRVNISWTLVSQDMAEIVWREEGGPPVKPPSRRGFGLDLIEKIAGRELGSAVDMQFLPSGVRCVIRVPVRQLLEFVLRTPLAG